MDKELNLLLPLINNIRTLSVNNTSFRCGTIGTHDVVVCKCGIGKVNAAIGTLTLVDTFHPDLVINSGVAGGTGGKAGILDVVVASEVAYHDVWCGPGTKWGQAAGYPEKFTCALHDNMVAQLGKVKRGLIASGDIFVSRPDDVQRILHVQPDAVAVDMESGAIAQVCALKNVPFVCIRVISDTPGGADNIAQYENFWTDAPASTFRIIDSLLNNVLQ